MLTGRKDPTGLEGLRIPALFSQAWKADRQHKRLLLPPGWETLGIWRRETR
jgi:hypothetical protein